MIKKLIPFILLCLLFGVNAYAENENPTPQAQGEATEGRMPEGERGRMGGGRPGGMPDMQNGERPTSPENNGNMPNERPEETQKNENQAMPSENESGNAPENQPNQNQNSENNSSGGEKEEKNPPEAFENENGGENSEENPENKTFEGERGQFSENFGERRDMQTENEKKNFFEEYFTPVIAMVLLLGAFVFVRLYKRKSY